MQPVPAKQPRRIFTPQQKYAILQDIDAQPSIRQGLEKHRLSPSLYHKWKKQLEVGINATLRNTKPVKAADTRKLEEDNRRLKEIVLNQSLELCELKKTLSLLN